ncbi:MAG: chemotaxis protein [Herbinix sp.]|nr:chemotaxis protein [Herbinix sp.]
MEKQTTYNVKRVDRVNVIVTIALVLLICTQVIIMRGIANSIAPIGASIIIAGVAIMNYFIKMNQNVKALIYAMLPAVVSLALFKVDGFAINKHYMIIVTTAMITLYFKSTLIVIYSVAIDLGMLLLYIVTPDSLMGSDNNIGSFIKVFTLMIGIQVLLYFLTKWGNDLVQTAAKKEEEARDLLEKLEATFRTIEVGTESLDQNVATVDSQLQGINLASKGILDSVQQMAMAIQEEASSVYKINESMTQSLQVVNQTIEISKKIVDKSDHMSQKVEDGWKKMNEVSGRMNTVNTAIASTATTVVDLKDSLEKVNNLLGNIKVIAGQTNLLALNASIESARAGEQGKGFAVVADNIRNLSEQSKKIVENINVVTSAIFEKSEIAARMSDEGEKAVLEGMKMIEEVSSYLNDIKIAYHDTNDDLSRSMNEIAVAANNFISIQEQITNVASISEENSASTEEILSIIEDENSQISYINSSVAEVHGLSKKLKDMVQDI